MLGAETFAPVHLFGSANKKTQEQPRLRSFFCDVTVMNIPMANDPWGAHEVARDVPVEPSTITTKQIMRFQAEVYRLAAASHASGGGGGQAREQV